MSAFSPSAVSRAVICKTSGHEAVRDRHSSEGRGVLVRTDKFFVAPWATCKKVDMHSKMRACSPKLQNTPFLCPFPHGPLSPVKHKL